MVKDFVGNIRIIFIIIPFILISCQSRESHLINNFEPDSTTNNLIINGDFEEWNGQYSLSWWSTRFLLPNPMITGMDNSVSLHGSYLGKNFIYQKVRVRPGDFHIAKIRIINYEGRSSNVGIYILDEGVTIGFHILPKRKYNNPQELSVKFKTRSNLVELRIGFTKIGSGSVVFDNAVLFRTDEIPISYNKNYAEHLNQILKLELFDSSSFHSNILKISKYVNSILISPLRNYYNLRDVDEQEFFLENERMKRMGISTKLNELLPGSRFADYSKLDIKESANAYCVQSSLSCEDLLKQFNVPVNQLHMWDNKGEAIHQFYQYWNPYLQKWVIVDPFYGINYVNEQSELIGYRELMELFKDNNISTGNLKHVEIEKFYFNLEELRKGWNTQLKEGLFSDLRKTYPH